MQPIRIGMIGSGWRAQTFMRIIRTLPEVFSLQAVYFRNPNKAEAFEAEWPGVAFTDFERFTEQDFDFVLLAVPRKVAPDYCERLFSKKIAVLCETPPAGDIERLNRIWEIKNRLGGKIQVAEQYFLQPYHSAVLKLVGDGLLGEISSVKISMMHDYHGLSMVRKLLSAGFLECTVSGKSFSHPVVATCGRNGMESADRVVTDHRKAALFVFQNEKICFFDFSNEQYFNYLRTRHLAVSGSRGELWDNRVHYLNEEGYPVSAELQRVDTGLYSNLEGYFHRGILLGERFFYRNPLEQYAPRLNDDELAMASMLMGMKNYIDTGVPIYPLEEALQDTYLGFLMDESIRTGKPVTSEKQSWYPKKVNR